MMRVLSDIYPADVLPVRDGWYLTRIVGGEFWLLVAFRAGHWRNDIGMPMNGRPREWRGLAFDPAAAEVAWNGVFVRGAQCC